MRNQGRIIPQLATLALLLVWPNLLRAQTAALPAPGAVYVQPGVEVLARGPVHEAFAEALVNQPQPSPVVPRQPPLVVNELPAEQKPVGNGVQWIPGYWAWDDDRLDFVWVSGLWRLPPPGRQWLPGHWNPAGTRWQWVAGFWAPLEQQVAFTYLPPPPPVLDGPPLTPPPGPNYSFVSGTWVYHESRYVWRPGYWVPQDPNWVWVPGHHLWTPAGYLFVDGYWDYALHQRGLLFAPVALDLRARTQPAFVYQPRYVVEGDGFSGALFVRPASRHYYFGDYFEARYQGLGYTAWFDVRVGGAYDPLFGHCRAQQPDRRVWEHDIRELYAARRAGIVPRPPRTLAEQQSAVNNVNNATGDKAKTSNLKRVTMVSPVDQLNRVELKLEPVPPAAQLSQRQAAEQLAGVSRERRRLESHLAMPGRAPTAAPTAAKIVQLTLPKAGPTGISAGKVPPPLPTPPLVRAEVQVNPTVPPPPKPVTASPPPTPAVTAPKPIPLVKPSEPPAANKKKG